MLETISHGPIREIRLKRPPVNALNLEFVSQQTATMRAAMAEADAIVLSGLPGIFSAGLDVVELLPMGHKDMRVFWQAFFELLEVIACSDVPVATAITGHSPAGGAVISLMTDYRVMSRGHYKIGLNETRVGLVIPQLLQDMMSMAVGSRLCEKMIVTGSLVSPDQALETGLVDATKSGFEETIQHALQWCEELLELPRHAMLANRNIARNQIREKFSRLTTDAVDTLVEAWFTDATQAVLHDLVTRLKKKN